MIQVPRCLFNDSVCIKTDMLYTYPGTNSNSHIEYMGSVKFGLHDTVITLHTLMSHHQNVGQNHKRKTTNKSFEDVQIQISGDHSNKSKLQP
jgi:hypothetical protein